MRKKEKSKGDIIFCFVIIMFVMSIVCAVVMINLENKAMKELASFSEKDYEYMHKDIETTYGNGEKFHIVSEKEEVMEKYDGEYTDANGGRTSTYRNIGREVSILGYFDSQEELYSVGYAKYIEDQPLLKNGKAGTIILTAINTNHTKDEYFKSQKN